MLAVPILPYLTFHSHLQHLSSRAPARSDFKHVTCPTFVRCPTLSSHDRTACLQACTQLRLRQTDLFEVPDLVNSRNMNQVLHTLSVLRAMYP